MGIQFAVPRNDDFSISGFNGTLREESDGSRTLKTGGSYSANRNSGYYQIGDNSLFFPRIIIKNANGETLKTIDQSLRKVSNEWDFSITENFPYSILKDESLTVTVSFHSGKGAYKTSCNKNCPPSNFSGLLSSNIVNSSLIQLVNVEEETRLNNIETKRLANIENKRLADIENKRLADIEKSRILKLQNDKLLLDEIRFSGFEVSESRLVELLNQDFDELENFYKIDESPLVESIPSIDSLDSLDSMPKQIPLETVTPVLAVLGIGLVSYYLLKGNKK
tara:strand:- start:276 stop:1112 length:837 start_codon:yes stop_codon:yes gene_type:complete